MGMRWKSCWGSRGNPGLELESPGRQHQGRARRPCQAGIDPKRRSFGALADQSPAASCIPACPPQARLTEDGSPYLFREFHPLTISCVL